ncbi:transcriptional repressor LexA [Candidatus Gracilibacteria bacterium]|nr:transcriptional repressor LexA [Candidatus Gracilibacteria bacterium]MCF7855957.1 transcriptional repressor LexA [Candidatus Gracilibacteria bacterium]MCF7896350.1 transcriptional repressor LexA [Candidatus Gracilibacteria bacterium]
MTTRQKRFLELLRSYIQLHGESPTLNEMKIWMEENDWGDISSLNSVKQYLDALAEKGFIERESKKRGITLLGDELETQKIPLIDSRVSCGSAVNFLEDNARDFLEVSKKLIRSFDKVFAFRCEGDSMNEAGIDDGDCVIVKPEPTEISDGDLVLASVNDCGVVKKFKKNGETISLLPQSSNPIHKPIYLHSSDEGAIVGKVLTVLKN